MSDQSMFGLTPATVMRLKQCFEQTSGIQKVWVYGSRARGDHRHNSDIDLLVDAPGWTDKEFSNLWAQVDALRLLHGVDLTQNKASLSAEFRTHIERDRVVFWEPRRSRLSHEQVGTTQLKEFQSRSLEAIDTYLQELIAHRQQSQQAVAALQGIAGVEDVLRQAADFPQKAWAKLKSNSLLPLAFAEQPHSSRFDGAGRAIPNVCLKIPTGGGKTLLAAASVGRVFSGYLKQHTGLVLWVVPNDAIYQQTLKTLKDRDHPYRQMLNTAGAGRVKILEKTSALSKIDTDSHLCVMLLMLASASRQSKETLRFFRDRGNVLGFTPREDDVDAHFELLQQVPNLDAYASWGTSQEEARATRGSIIKSSLGNVMRLLRPMVVIDEGHHAYTETALKTIDGFNPCFMLELSATPRVSSDRGLGSNILVNVRGTDLDDAEMIKLPIHVEMRSGTDWQSCLAASLKRVDSLQAEAHILQNETHRYIRPILLVQVERTGKDLRDAGFIHAEDAKAYLMQLGLSEKQIAIKTSDRNDLSSPENLDLLSPQNEVRAIITKQALQEGWDCPFAYVLCALAAGKDVRAMTQLVGRILRLPHVAKTGRQALDACYVICHNAVTAEVVKAIKHSLEAEGMGDLGLAVTGAGSEVTAQKKSFKRRDKFSDLKIYLPRVTWVRQDALGINQRRELDYDSDILAAIDWGRMNAGGLALHWTPDLQAVSGQQIQVGLELLQAESVAVATERSTYEKQNIALDRALLVRGVLDIVPNAWIAWSHIHAVVERLLASGLSESTIALSSASLLEKLRLDLEAQRDAMAQTVFESFAAAGKIQFSLQADATDYKLPQSFELDISGEPQYMIRPDATLVERSLFEPALTALVDSGLERDVACYIDGKTAVSWWHRNVAKTQYGLQGWRRHKIYPDFVFAKLPVDGKSTMVVLETKGLHLAGSIDTLYKQSVLARLTQMFQSNQSTSLGSMELIEGDQTIVCDLVFDAAWQGSLNTRYFPVLQQV